MVSLFAADGFRTCAAIIHTQLHGYSHRIVYDIHAVGGWEVAGEPIKVIFETLLKELYNLLQGKISKCSASYLG